MGDDAESNLEMRCTADEAWYDGTLRVSPESKDLIVVHFNDFDDDEDETFHRSELLDPARLRSRVRVRSLQLQDAQCNRVYPGQKICGCLDDDEDRKYYDAKVTTITKKKHAFNDDGEECRCKFEVFWLDGPRKREHTVIGCAEVCFLSLDPPEDDPMVKNLVKSLAGNGDQPRRKLVKSSVPKSVPKRVPNGVPSPRPRTPSPSLELAPSKKQPSREPSPPAAPPNQKLVELPRTKTLPIGSKKRRIMLAEEKLADLASDNDKVGMDGTNSRKDSRHRSEEGDEAATGHGNESDAAEPRAMTRGSKGTKKSVQAAEKKRLVKGKAKVGAPEVTDREAASKEDVAVQGMPSRTGTFKERLKLNTKRMANAGKVDRPDIVTQTLAERVKLKKTAKMAATAPAPAPAAAVPDDAVKQDNMPVVQSLGERVKLKTLQKSPAVSPLEVHKESLQKIGKQVVRKQITKRKLIQLEDSPPDPLRSKFDKVVKPRTTSKAKETAAEPNSAEPEQPQVQKRKAGRPRKNPPPEPAKPAPDAAMAKKQHDKEPPSAQKQSPLEEEVPDANAEEIANANAEEIVAAKANKKIKKRPREEERSQHDSDDTVSNDSSHDEHVRKQANTGKKKKKLIIGDHTNDTAEEQEDHSSPARHEDEATEILCRMENVSIPDRIRDIENKYGRNGSSFSAPQAALELISLAGPDHYRENLTENHLLTVSSPSASLNLDPVEEAGGKRRRMAKRPFVITDDEMEDEVVRKQHEFLAVDQCSPTSDPKNTSSALDEEVAVEKQDGETRVLVLENMERDASALDAIQLLQSHTDGVCAVHVLPVLEFQASATGYALYRDRPSALKALRWLTSMSRYIISPKGRPWIVSQAKESYGPCLYGIAAHTAYKSDDPSMCGIISDQPHAHDLIVVTKRDNSAFIQAQQMSKTYEEHKSWRKELYERIIQHENKG